MKDELRIFGFLVFGLFVRDETDSSAHQKDHYLVEALTGKYGTILLEPLGS